LEQYPDHLDINIWVSSTISTLSQDPKTQKWRVTIIRRQTRLNGQVSEQERTFSVKHIIFCTGMGSQNPPIPSFLGMDTFKGQILHSSQYKHARDYQGKKVVVLGSGTSGTSSIFTSPMFVDESAILANSPRYLCGLP